VAANTEKTIFLAPQIYPNPVSPRDIDDLCLPAISPQASTLHTALSVAFPTSSQPRGASSWYLLDALRSGQRYELRVCWVATQPTEFYLRTFTLDDILDTPELLSTVVAYSESRLSPSCPENPITRTKNKDGAVLFLQVQSSADFFTNNRTLMNNTPLVGVDLILDPYLLNIFPSSLLPTAGFITVVGIGSWVLASVVWTRLSSIGASD
ncbi:hypothetical protein EJ06DRAFT_454058, partial [Trichodelitschia bisporula]